MICFPVYHLKSPQETEHNCGWHLPAFHDPVYSITSQPLEHCHGVSTPAPPRGPPVHRNNTADDDYVYLIKPNSSLSAPAGVLCCGVRWSLLFGWLSSEGLRSLSHSWLACLTDHASTRFHRGFFFLCPPDMFISPEFCSGLASWLCCSPSSHVFTQVSHQLEESWPPCCCQQSRLNEILVSCSLFSISTWKLQNTSNSACLCCTHYFPRQPCYSPCGPW